MTEKVINCNKKEISSIKFKDWKDLEGHELLDLLSVSAEFDAELYELAIKKVPKLMKQSKIVLKNNKYSMKQFAKLSKQTKKYYYKVSKAILKLIKQNEVAAELKLELIDLLKEVTVKMELCDQRDKAFISSQQKKAMSYGTVALLAVAAIYGVKVNRKA